MIGAIIGAAASVAGGIVGGAQANKAANEAKKQAELSHRETTSALRKQINQDYTQTAAAQSALNRAKDAFNERIQAANATKAVMGGTDASVAQAKAQANNAMADAAENVAIRGEEMARQAENQQMAENQNYRNQMASIANAKAQANAQAGSQAMQAGMNVAMADMQSHLDNGKGLFGDKFGGDNGTIKKIDTPATSPLGITPPARQTHRMNLSTTMDDDNMFGF